MARPTTAKWTKFLIMLGDGATPTETFAQPCGLVAKAINFAAGSSEIAIQDCADPDAPAWMERAVTTFSAGITGSGILAMEAWPTWRVWFFSGAPKNCRVKIDMPLANNGGYFQGAFLITALDLSGSETDGKIRIPTLTMQSDGPVAWTAAAA